MEKRSSASFEYDGPISISFIELPFENIIVSASGNMGELRVTSPDGVCYRGKPQHQVQLHHSDLLSIERIKGKYHYVIKVPLKGGYWRPKVKEALKNVKTQ